MLARVFNQDSMNLPNVQIGLEAAQHEHLVLARYQESKIRLFHHILDEYIKR